MSRFQYLVALLVLAGSLALAWVYLQPQAPTIARPLPDVLRGHFPLLPQQASVSRPFPIEIEGDVVAERMATLRASADGVLQHLHVGNDEQVAAGALLATLDSSELRQKTLDNTSKVKELEATLLLYSQTSNPDLRKLDAALEGNRQKLRYGKASFERVEELFRRGLVSGKEHADAAVQLEADRLALNAASREYDDARSLSAASYLKIKNQLQVATIEQQRLRQTQAGLTLAAPFSGRIRRYAPPANHDTATWVEGDTVKAGEPLFYLESSARVVKVDASAEVLGPFSVGDSVTVFSRTQEDAAFQGVVQDISRAPYEDGAALESIVTLKVSVTDPSFAQLLSRKVRVTKDVVQHGVTLPAEAVLSEGGERFVYLKPCNDRGQTYARRRVTVSAQEGAMAMVTSGLLTGECVAHISEGRQWRH